MNIGQEVRSGAPTSATGLKASTRPEKHEQAECCIVVVSYNSTRHISSLLDSLPGGTRQLRTRCIVVDNQSSDDTLAVLRSRDEVEIVEAGSNLGYAGAINLARTLVDPRASLLILNPDLVLEPGAVADLYEALDQPGVGVAVPMLLTPGGERYSSLRREPSLTRAVGDALLGARWPRRPAWLSETIRYGRAYTEQHDVAWAGGAAMLISAACNIAVGDWDDRRFFLYSEEADFAARARRCGFRIRYVPTARVRHEDGGSGRSPALLALMSVNRIRYYEKYHRRPATSFFRAVVILHSLLRCTDPDQRVALRVLVHRAKWRYLPGGEAQRSGQVI
jgi:N-acetylglucosaminyl-diphospho-decaprenol L-rhamnosyltransferase